MNFIDEQQLPRLQIHQQPNNVPRALQGRSAGDPAGHPKLFSQHQSHGGFAQARGPIQQDVIEGITASERRLDSYPENLLQFGLSDVVV
jgi:hypothetical protein